MIKVTLPNGMTVEGDSAVEVVNVIDYLHADPEPAKVIELEPEPEPEPEDATIFGWPHPMPEPGPTYPHLSASKSKGRGVVVVGWRGDEVIRAAKALAQKAGDRDVEFSTKDVAAEANSPLATTSATLANLIKKGVVEHSRNTHYYRITARGWKARFYTRNQG